MRLSIDLAWLLTTALVALRLGVTFALTPVLAFGALPARFRVLLVVALAALMVSATGARAPLGPLDVAGFAGMAAGEALLGALLAFGILAAFAAFQIAGRVIDLQLGFGAATLIDPGTRGHAPLLGTLVWMTAVAAFFAVDGHHALLRAFAVSLETVPPGAALRGLSLAPAIGQFGLMFAFALALAAPVMFVLLLVDAALAVMARTMPQMNMFFLSLPLKVLVGLLALSLSITHAGPLVRRTFESILAMWEGVLTR